MKPFPKEVSIQMTTDRARKEIDMDDYNEDSTQLDEVLGVTIQESIHPVTIKSWKDLEKKMSKEYELTNEEDIEEYREYLESREIP